MVGRDDVLARVRAELDAGARVVTLTGPPGIGKTRAALACLEEHGASSAFCDLSHVASSRDLGFAVLSFLRGEGEHVTDADADALVGDVLEAAGPTTLVLDNFEQIVDAAPSIERWCSAAPELTVIVTSRERLAIDGEIVVELEPLDAERAIELFVKRAKDAGGSAPKSADDATRVASIVRRLEGIPLAIELAAARTRLMSLRDLDERLAAGREVLAQRKGARHATLASAIAWSWDLLSQKEQVALARCSVFAGSFTLESAEKIVDAEDATALLAALRDKSLLHADGDGRLALYVSIREYAAARLREMEPHGARTRMAHARAFAEMARASNESRQMQGRAPNAQVSDDIRREKQNVVAALAALRDAPDAARDEITTLRADLAVAAAQLHAMPGEACIAELTSALARLPAHATAHRALVLLSRQSVFASLGRYEEALADLGAMLDARETPSALRHLALVYRGIQLRHWGFPREARASHETAARELARSPRILAMNDACLGRLLFDLGDIDGSRDFNGRAIAFGEKIGESWLGALAIANLAQLEQELGDFPRAEELLRDALEKLRDVGEVYEATYASAYGDLFFEQGRFAEARRWYEEGARFFRGAFVTHRQAALAIAASAALEAHDGDHDRARALFEAANRIASRAKNAVVEASVALHGASVELLSVSDGDRPRILDAWRARVARFADPKTDVGATVSTSFEARFALRIARRALELAGARSSAHVIRVDRRGDWFELLDGSSPGSRVDLRRRGALRRILLALVAQRGRGIKQTELSEIGWPGERVLADAAATRVRVAIATLRQLGLRTLLVTRDDGYALDARVRVETV